MQRVGTTPVSVYVVEAYYGYGENDKSSVGTYYLEDIKLRSRSKMIVKGHDLIVFFQSRSEKIEFLDRILPECKDGLRNRLI